MRVRAEEKERRSTEVQVDGERRYHGPFFPITRLISSGCPEVWPLAPTALWDSTRSKVRRKTSGAHVMLC